MRGTADRLHDLPVTWDGLPVYWGAWTRLELTYCQARPVSTCPCGSGSTVVQTTSGVVDPLGRSGPSVFLRVTRCAACGLDRVHDPATDQAWILTEQDYGPDGSRLQETPPSTVPEVRALARSLVARGHVPECPSDAGQCERCARAAAGAQVLAVLDRDRPGTDPQEAP